MHASIENFDGSIPKEFFDMRQSGRKLVYVDPGELPAPLHAGLRAAGWEIFAAPDADSARALIQHHDLIVGLATFDERYPVAYLNALKNLIFATKPV
ncbi:MAG: hypothetical protein M3Z21_04520 [Pseudomonadota bacterium]|nr:hypothetical protein [Pseudomonadota bacterium]